jgi:cellulose synthase/poly-beta-1,6-N-acetylglucosamine synthase-like glycosyltransferase
LYPGGGSGLSSVDFEQTEDRRRRRTVARPFVPEPSRVPPGLQSRARSRCPELDCLRGRLPPGTLATAEQRALALGIGADRVLITAGVISEDNYVRALAGWLRVPFERLDLARDACPLRDEQFIDAARFGLLPLRVGETFIWVIAPQVLTARHLVTGAHPLPKDRFRLTSPQRLQQFVLQYGTKALGARAADALRIARPELSAAVCPPPVRVAWFAAIAAVASAAIVFPGPASVLTSAVLALTFLAWTGLRLVGAATAWRGWRPVRSAVHDLPLYTIIVALYDEAAAVPDLIGALRRLDYPREKLQIILALEPDDMATRLALMQHDLGPPFEIAIAPDVGPRTKPKALNAALALARGTFTVVFDAEDRPAPDQLHRALDVFLAEGEAIACVQARLTIDNTADGWLAKLFTAEYAGLFDVLLPGLSERGLPLPLGGSSNHFRTDALREIGGWDPYNVTEDADLGMRLARFGHGAAVIASTTYEEAPARIGPWIRQRTRWFKGWTQTWLVHMRHPVRLARELGLDGFLTFQLVVGGTVLSALVHPLFIALFAYALATERLLPGADFASVILAALCGGALVAGYLTSAALGLIGLKRRGLLRHGFVLLLMPLHWLLLSAAAWRALWQLLRDPYRWEKTAHGLARTSRLAAFAGVARTTITLRNNGADRRPRPRAAA